MYLAQQDIALAHGFADNMDDVISKFLNGDINGAQGRIDSVHKQNNKN